MRTETRMAPVAIVWVTLLAVTVVGCGGGEHTETPASPSYAATLAEAQQQATRETKRVVLLFYVVGAPAVKALFEETVPHRGVRGFYERYVWVQVDINQEKAISRQYRIYVAPTIVILEPPGQEVARYEKFIDGPEMADFLSQHVRR